MVQFASILITVPSSPVRLRRTKSPGSIDRSYYYYYSNQINQRAVFALPLASVRLLVFRLKYDLGKCRVWPDPGTTRLLHNLRECRIQHQGLILRRHLVLLLQIFLNDSFRKLKFIFFLIDYVFYFRKRYGNQIFSRYKYTYPEQ